MGHGAVFLRYPDYKFSDAFSITQASVFISGEMLHKVPADLHLAKIYRMRHSFSDQHLIKRQMAVILRKPEVMNKSFVVSLITGNICCQAGFIGIAVSKFRNRNVVVLLPVIDGLKPDMTGFFYRLPAGTHAVQEAAVLDQGETIILLCFFASASTRVCVCSSDSSAADGAPPGIRLRRDCMDVK